MELKTFESIKIGLASPEKIRSWSYGAVEKPETINYRTQKPERDGLYCERIFGPTKDWECHCGKYKKIRFKGKVCERCGVEVTRAKVRRERMGHIALAAPCSHIWYFKGTPSRIGQVLEVSQKRLEEVLYFTKYIVVDAGNTELVKKQLLTEKEYSDMCEKYEDDFYAAMGAEAIKDLLEDYDPERYNQYIVKYIDQFAAVTGLTEQQIRDTLAKRFLVITDNGNNEKYEVGQFVSRAEYNYAITRYNWMEEEKRSDNCIKVIYGSKYIEKLFDEKIAEANKNGEYDEIADKSKWINCLEWVSDELKDELKDLPAGQKRIKLLKRLDIIESFRLSENKPEWMVLDVVPVIPPDLRPMVMLDGGRYATSDLNDLYRRVINRNNRLKKMLELEAPDIIIRNEKRMLQEAVDALIDNGRHGRPVTGPNNRALKSLSDMLKGKQGRFRQNLLGKRVDYSGRSVIVVGPELKMYQCGLPKEMALELFKPFVMKRLVDTGKSTNIKSARKKVDRAENDVWDALENVIKSHPVLLNRAPTLHRLGIQAFEPILVEGRAIKLHPLVCTAFNADFDGDQMAVHLPLSNEAILETQILMLQSHNILNPANGAPITVPSQDMVLGLYYITKIRPGAKGEGLIFYGPEEALIARNEGRCDLHALVKVIVDDLVDGKIQKRMIETSVGRVIVNGIIPDEVGFFNDVISKKTLRGLISNVIKAVGMAEACAFLDGIKNLGYRMAYVAGLSFNLGDIIIPPEKEEIVKRGRKEVEEITNNYNMGFITNKERYNQVIDAWTHVNTDLGNILMKEMTEADQGFNAVYMMLDSGARGSKDQIKQLSGMRGLMAKPQKAGAEGAQIIENPILSNFKEGMSVLEYFIASHGARKGLADTAMKTADAGYLTRRLVDVSHDVIITQEDCGTLRGLVCTALKNGDEIISSLYERILGRVSVHDIIHPTTGELIVKSGEEITEAKAKIIDESPIESVEIRSVLTCESKKGVCMKCYGRNLATARMVQLGEAVGVIAAQAIGEPGTQLTLRTFHAGGIASNAAANAKIAAKNKSRIEFDELSTVPFVEEDEEGNDIKCEKVVSHLAEIRFVDPNTNIILATLNVPYGSSLYHKEGEIVEKDTVIARWDPFNAVIVSQYAGTLKFNDVQKDQTYRAEVDETTGLEEKIITDSKNKAMVPSCDVIDANGEIVGTYNFPVGGHLVVEDGQTIKTGEVLVKIPRAVGGAGDITGGLPRVTELLEARNPSNPAVVSEIDGEVTMGKVKRGNREIIVTSKTGDQKKYLVSLSKQILVQEHDAVRAGTPLSDGSVTPGDILAIMGPTAVQEYIVNQIQDVYRLQGVAINDKHFEVVVRQMMRKVRIDDPGDTTFLEQELVDKLDFAEENDRIWGKKVVVHAGDSTELKPGQIITARKLRDENSALKRRDMKLVQVRDAVAATSTQILQGITRAALGTKSFMSAASFQETTKVLNEAAIRGKVDYLEGMKENVICGHLIPAGTGLRQWEKLVVGSKEEYERMQANRKNVLDYADSPIVD